jgi:hypothetical protein
MSKTITFFLLLLFSMSSFAQKISSSVISAQGGSFNSNTLSLEWTLGENFVETLFLNGKVLTQGFQQPYIVIENKNKLAENPIFDMKISIGPNPTSDVLTVKVLANDIQPYQITLYDDTGKILKTMKSSFDNSYIEIEVYDIPRGMYLLNVSDLTGKFLKSFKMIKI